MKTHLILSGLLLIAFAPTFAQVKGNAAYERQANFKNNVAFPSQSYSSQGAKVAIEGPTADFPNDSAFVLQADALMNVKANSYVAYLSISQVGASLDSVYASMNRRINALLTGLDRAGAIEQEAVYVDFISLVPTFEYEVENKLFSKNATEIPTGYELNKAVHIPYDKPEQLDQIMMAAARGEIYDLVKVDYIVSDIEGIYDSLRSVGVALINKKKAEYAKMGFSFDQAKWTVIADDVVSTYPVERYKSFAAFSSSSLGYDKFKKVNKVKKHKSYYYDKINYNDFDIVIHPTIVEPVVQFMYTLKVMFTLGESGGQE